MSTFAGAGVRYFDGHPYHLVDYYITKSEASDKAKRLRAQDKLARVVRTTVNSRYTRYLVYSRRWG
jgi:hypothetical protein